MLTATEVAEMLHLHVNTVKRLGDRGELPFYRVCKRGDRRFRLDDVMKFLARTASPSSRSLPGGDDRVLCPTLERPPARRVPFAVRAAFLEQVRTPVTPRRMLKLEVRDGR